MEEKVIETLKSAIINKYFLYTSIIIGILIIINELRKYKLYLYDCKILNQKPKPLGYTINTISSIIQANIIIMFGFTGYAAYQNPDIFRNKTKTIIETQTKNTTPKKNFNNKTEPKHYQTVTINTNEKPPIQKLTGFNLVKTTTPPVKRKTKEQLAKEKLKRELEAAMKDVDRE
jgi:hypothetical protein